VTSGRAYDAERLNRAVTTLRLFLEQGPAPALVAERAIARDAGCTRADVRYAAELLGAVTEWLPYSAGSAAWWRLPTEAELEAKRSEPTTVAEEDRGGN